MRNRRRKRACKEAHGYIAPGGSLLGNKEGRAGPNNTGISEAGTPEIRKRETMTLRQLRDYVRSMPENEILCLRIVFSGETGGET